MIKINEKEGYDGFLKLQREIKEEKKALQKTIEDIITKGTVFLGFKCREKEDAIELACQDCILKFQELCIEDGNYEWMDPHEAYNLRNEFEVKEDYVLNDQGEVVGYNVSAKTKCVNNVEGFAHYWVF